MLNRFKLLAFVFPLLLGASHPAQEQDQPPTYRFESRVDVIAVQVFVTDKEGQAVDGLTAEDFEVRDEGDRRPIVAVYEVDATVPPQATTESIARAASRRQFLLLFDLSFSNPDGLLRARNAGLQFIEELEPWDLGAVATFSARFGIEMLVNFTTDRKQMAVAVNNLGLEKLRKVQDPLKLAYWLDEPVGPQSEFEDYQRSTEDPFMASLIRWHRSAFDRAQSETYRRHVEAFLDSLNQLNNALDTLQGRKQVLLFSGGFHEQVLVGRTSDQQQNAEAAAHGRFWEVNSETYFGDAEVRQQLEQTVEQAARSDTLIHTIDVTGLADAEETRQGGGTARSGRESLNRISGGTGGLLIRNTNDLAGSMGEILDLSRRYYVVAFQPGTFSEPGRFHKLKISVDRKGFLVSHRKGFTEPDPDKTNPWFHQLKAAEIITKNLTGGSIPLEALAVPYRNAEGEVALPVVLEIDTGVLMEEQTPGERKLEIFGYALNQQGAIEDVMIANSSSSSADEKGIRVHTAFRVPEGTHDLRFLVRDQVTGRWGAEHIKAHVPSFTSGQVVLYPPLFMARPEDWTTVEVASRHNPRPEQPFRVASERFTPQLRPQIANGQTSNVCVMFSIGTAQYPPESDLEIRAQLLDADGRAFQLVGTRVEKAVAESDGFRRFVLAVTPVDIPAGDYRFRVSLKDPLSETTNESEQLVRIEPMEPMEPMESMEPTEPTAETTQIVPGPSPPDGGPGAKYLGVVSLYRLGQISFAFKELYSSDPESIDQAIQELERHGCADDDLLAATLLHTEVAAVKGSSGDHDGQELHLEAARKLNGLVKDVDRLEAFEKRWLLVVGYYYLSQLDEKRAMESFEAALRLSPDDSQVVMAIGTVHEAMSFVGPQSGGKPSASVEAFPSTGSSSYREMLRRLRTESVTHDRLTDAEALYREAIRFDPERAETRLRLGRVLQQSGLAEDAENEFRWVLQNSKDRNLLCSANMFMGRILEREQRDDAAVQYYRDAVELRPKWQVTRIALSHALHRMGEPAAAKEVLDEAIERGDGERRTGLWQFYFGSDRFIDMLRKLRREILQ